jgi:hypothetical protein
VRSAVSTDRRQCHARSLRVPQASALPEFSGQSSSEPDGTVSNEELLAVHHLLICRLDRNSRLVLCELCGPRDCAPRAAYGPAPCCSPTNPVRLPGSTTGRLSVSDMDTMARLLNHITGDLLSRRSVRSNTTVPTALPRSPIWAPPARVEGSISRMSRGRRSAAKLLSKHEARRDCGEISRSCRNCYESRSRQT